MTERQTPATDALKTSIQAANESLDLLRKIVSNEQSPAETGMMARMENARFIVQHAPALIAELRAIGNTLKG